MSSMDKYFTDPNYLSLSAKAPHPNAAKLYIDFACSAEGQKEIAEDGEFVLASGCFSADQRRRKSRAAIWFLWITHPRMSLKN